MQHALNNHLIKCESNSKEVFPDPGTYIEYTDILSAQQSSEINIFGFADFESKLSPIKDQNECKICDHKIEQCVCMKLKCTNCRCYYKYCKCFFRQKSFTIKKEIHILISYSIIFIDNNGKIIFEKCYCDKNVGENFIETLLDLQEKLLQYIVKNKEQIEPSSLSSEELKNFNIAKNCEKCNIAFNSADRISTKNLHHDHYSGRYIGALCTLCNLASRSQTHIPLYFHNFQKYDSKLFIKMLNKNIRLRNTLNPLFSNMQHIRSLQFNSYKFFDSLDHLPSSLSQLVEELSNPYQKHQFLILKQSEIIKNYFPSNLSEIEI